MNKIHLLLTVFLVFFATTPALAVPALLNHQGHMMGSDNVPVGGVSDVTFSIYNAPTGGTLVWSHTLSVVFDNGFYSVTLGPGNPSLSADTFDNSELYLGITLDGQNEFAPRNLIVSVPYSMQAAKAQSVEGEVRAVGGLTVDGTEVINSEGNIIGATPTANNHLTTKAYVDGSVDAAVGDLTNVLACPVGASISAETFGDETVLVCRYGGDEGGVTGSGSTDRIAKFTGSDVIGSSEIYENGGDVGIGTTSPGSKLEVNGNVIANSPIDNNHLATKGYVDAHSSPGGRANGVTDMFNAYYMQLGLFTPHGGDVCDSSESFVEIAGGFGYCIEKNQRSSDHWVNAKRTCALAGKRLPEPAEWKFACMNANSLGLNNMIGGWEIASNVERWWEYSDANTRMLTAPLLGYDGCDRAGWIVMAQHPTADSTQYEFRCVR